MDSSRYECITRWEDFERWLAWLEAAPLVSLDTETDSLVEMQAQIVGLSWCISPGLAAYVPLAHALEDGQVQLPRDEVLAKLKPWLEDARQFKLGQHR